MKRFAIVLALFAAMAASIPAGKALLIVSNEVSSTTTVWQVQ